MAGRRHFRIWLRQPGQHRRRQEHQQLHQRRPGQRHRWRQGWLRHLCRWQHGPEGRGDRQLGRCIEECAQYRLTDLQRSSEQGRVPLRQRERVRRLWRFQRQHERAAIEDSSSTTKAGITEGAIDVREQPGRDLSGLDRNPDIDAGGLKTIFDQNKVAERQEMGQVAGYVGMRAAGDLAGQMGRAEGSKERIVLHGAVGAAIASLGGGDALAGGLGATANQAAIPAIANYLMDQGYKADSPEFATMMQVGAISIGAVAGEGSGASAALDGTKYNYLSNRQIDELKDALANCKDQACRDSVTAEAKKASASNDLALAMKCQSGDATACYKGLGALESYYGNASVPDSLKKDQR